MRDASVSYQRSKSFRLCHKSFGVTGCRLCILLFDGSSRRTLLTIIVCSLSKESVRIFGKPFSPEYIPLVKPTSLSSEPAGSLTRSCGHEAESKHTDYEREKTLRDVSHPKYARPESRYGLREAAYQGLMAHLDQEQPSPSSLAGYTSHMKKSISKQSRENICDAHAGPKPAQPNRKLVMFVEIREI